ncbi:hypothetical protein O5624_03710 [Escherichia coli]|nr:hypothetical protein [Escherichia coli]
MMPMTPPNWRGRCSCHFEDSALVSEAFAFVSDVFAADADLPLRWPVQRLRQPSLWLLKQTMRRFRRFSGGGGTG